MVAQIFSAVAAFAAVAAASSSMAAPAYDPVSSSSAVAPPSYPSASSSDPAPPAYSSDPASSSSSYAASSYAPIPSATAPAMPTCWSDCFAKYQVDSEGCLCTDTTGEVVSQCIASGCDSASADAYTAWLEEYCAPIPSASNTYAAPTDPVGYTNSYTTYAPTTYADGSVPPYPTSTGSVCTETSTMIWRSTTAYSTYEVTGGAGGSWGTATGTGAYATATGYDPVPATGGSSNVKAAGLLVGAVAALVALL